MPTPTNNTADAIDNPSNKTFAICAEFAMAQDALNFAASCPIPTTVLIKKAEQKARVFLCDIKSSRIQVTVNEKENLI